MLYWSCDYHVIFCLQAFSNMTSNIRRALFKVLLLTMFPDEGSVVIENGEQVNEILNAISDNINYIYLYNRLINGLLYSMDNYVL